MAITLGISYDAGEFYFRQQRHRVVGLAILRYLAAARARPAQEISITFDRQVTVPWADASADPHGREIRPCTRRKWPRI